MNTTAQTTTTNQTEDRLAIILDSIQDVKGKNIVKLDLRQLDDRPAEYFYICSGESTTQVSAIANRVQRRLKEELGELPKTSVGNGHANWVCLDYFDTVVHIFHPDTRAFYELEDLWSDAETTAYEDA